MRVLMVIGVLCLGCHFLDETLENKQFVSTDVGQAHRLPVRNEPEPPEGFAFTLATTNQIQAKELIPPCGAAGRFCHDDAIVKCNVDDHTVPTFQQELITCPANHTCKPSQDGPVCVEEPTEFCLDFELCGNGQDDDCNGVIDEAQCAPPHPCHTKPNRCEAILARYVCGDLHTIYECVTDSDGCLVEQLTSCSADGVCREGACFSKEADPGLCDAFHRDGNNNLDDGCERYTDPCDGLCSVWDYQECMPDGTCRDTWFDDVECSHGIKRQIPWSGELVEDAGCGLDELCTDMACPWDPDNHYCFPPDAPPVVRCLKADWCPSDGLCPKGEWGAVCTTELGWSKALCLENTCLRDAHCPSDKPHCVNPPDWWDRGRIFTPYNGLGYCSDGSNGNTCEARSQCNSGCCCHLRGDPPFCYDPEYAPAACGC